MSRSRYLTVAGSFLAVITASYVAMFAEDGAMQGTGILVASLAFIFGFPIVNSVGLQRRKTVASRNSFLDRTSSAPSVLKVSLASLMSATAITMWTPPVLAIAIADLHPGALVVALMFLSLTLPMLSSEKSPANESR